MRNAFAAELTALAQEDPRVVLLSGDIGNRLFDPFKAVCPERFFNCGVAEANMTGMAAGMAAAGLRPFTYTITPFGTTRCLEQIRVDLCYHKLPVVVTAVGAGWSYASLGATHHACEDIAFLRSLPEMTVICPGDSWEVRAALRAALQVEGPVYLRLGKKGEPVVHEGPVQLVVGRATVIQEGTRVCLVSTGNTLPLAREAGKLLGACVVSLHTVKPLDEDFLKRAFQEFEVVASLEEHSRLGGLGGALAEWLADHPSPARLVRLGTPDEFPHVAGNQKYLRGLYGLTPEAIAERLR